MNRNRFFTIYFISLCTISALFIAFFPTPAIADSTTKIETQINLINQEYTTTGTAVPTDNSLGLIQWQADKYNDETVYFEAIIRCPACNGGSKSADAALYTDAGSVVTGSSVSTTSQDTYVRVRTGDITSNLTNNEEYTVRLTRNSTNGTAYIQAARIIVVQSGTNISDTLNQIELGNNDTTTATSYELITGPKIYLYDSNRHSDIQNAYFEATLMGSDASAVMYASLSSSTDCSSTVTGSEVSITGTTWDRNRSSDIKSNLSDDTNYWVCVKTTTGDTGSIANAKLILEQSNASGIADTELIHHHINTPHTDNDATYTSQDFENQYNPSNFSADTRNYYFESTMQTTGGTGYSQLYNLSGATAISGGEVSTDSTSAYVRRRSSELHLNMPTSTNNLDTQLKNTAANTVTASNSWLIIWVHQIPDPELSFSIAAVSANTVHNEITTSEASTYSKLPFSHLSFNTPKYVAHQLYASTNAGSGYNVTIQMIAYMQGIYPGNNIDPFISTWGSPTTWTEPTGTESNVNSGWIGANTSDTRVTGWGSAAQKFGPVSNTANSIMTSTGTDSGTTVYVTYGLEVNIMQPADSYSGTIQYNILPIY